ncbi:MAG: hypothetical protein ACFFFT_18825 [Candidatus Thorarchaeota archaeon]
MENIKISQLVCPVCAKANEHGSKYCVNCGYKFPQRLLDIADTLESVQTFGIYCVSCVSIFLIIMTFFGFIEFGAGGFIMLIIVVVVIIFMLFYVKRLTPSASKVRRFIVTDDKIEIDVPHKPYFQINWSEFESIEINRILRGYAETTRTFYTFNFIGKNGKSILLEGGKDFKNIYKRIIPPLEEIALSKGKRFIGYSKKDKKAKIDSWKAEIDRN